MPVGEKKRKKTHTKKTNIWNCVDISITVIYTHTQSMQTSLIGPSCWPGWMDWYNGGRQSNSLWFVFRVMDYLKIKSLKQILREKTRTFDSNIAPPGKAHKFGQRHWFHIFSKIIKKCSCPIYYMVKTKWKTQHIPKTWVKSKK